MTERKEYTQRELNKTVRFERERIKRIIKEIDKGDALVGIGGKIIPVIRLKELLEMIDK